jgi:hypothetical protein
VRWPQVVLNKNNIPEQSAFAATASEVLASGPHLGRLVL